MTMAHSYGTVKPSPNVKLKGKDVRLTGMNDELMTRMNTMADILKNEFGIDLYISSGTRTAAEQAALVRHNPSGYITASVNGSPHRRGDAFDVAINSWMIPQFQRNKKAREMFGDNFNKFWNYVVNKAGLYRFSPSGDPVHHALPLGWRQRAPSFKSKNVLKGVSIPMSANITVNKGVRWDGLHSYMKELLNRFGDNMVRKYGVKPHFRHMHRTKADQQPHYDAYKAGRGGIAGRPGHSVHQAGLAADLDWPQIQEFFNKRPDLQRAYKGNFWNFLNAELAEAGLWRPHGMKDRPHIQPIENAEYHRRVNHKALMGSRGTWDVGGAPFEAGRTGIQDSIQTQLPSTSDSSVGKFWRAPEGAQARALAYSGRTGREILGWGTGPKQALPYNFTSVPRFNKVVERTAKENGVDPRHAAAFLNMIVNISAMGETALGTHQIGIKDKKDKGVFGTRDITFNEIKGKIKYYGRGLDPEFQRKVANARDIYDLNTEDQAIFSLIGSAGFKTPYKRIMQRGTQAIASGNRDAIRAALLDYITTLHWAGGSVEKSIANVDAAIRGGATWYGPSGRYFYEKRVLPMYGKRIDDYLNFVSRRR